MARDVREIVLVETDQDAPRIVATHQLSGEFTVEFAGFAAKGDTVAAALADLLTDIDQRMHYLESLSLYLQSQSPGIEQELNSRFNRTLVATR